MFHAKGMENLRLRVEVKGSWAYFYVEDDGCGIPEEYQRSIFQPFFRVDKSRSREYGGAGLGLSLVWEIAELHGGSVWVEKSSEKGTVIAVELPTQHQRSPKTLYSFFTASLAALRRSSLYGEGNEKAQPFLSIALGGWELFYELFTKSLLLEMPQENLIRRLQGFVILAVSGAKPLHCGDEYIVIAALPLELL